MTNEELVMCIQKGECRKENLEQLYLQNRNFVANVAKRYCGYAEFDDLMQEGFIGLCAACEEWDNCMGVSFLTYAYQHIRGTIHRYVLEQKSSVRIPEYQLNMIRKYEMIVSESIKNTSKRPSDRYLMLHLGISSEQLKQLKIDVKKANTKSLDEPLSEEDGFFSLGDSIMDPTDSIKNLEESIQREQLSKELWGIVDSLEKDQADVIRERYKNHKTVKATADKLQTTPGKVRSIEDSAMRKMRLPRNRKKLLPYLPERSQIYSMSISYSSKGYFMNTWTSAPEMYVLMNEEKAKRNY